MSADCGVPGPAGLRVELVNSRDKRLALAAARLGRRLAKRFPAARGGLASVVLADDAVLAGLNRRWRRRSRPTDVLSFPMGHLDPETGRRVLGEVYVSREHARVQGRTYGTGYYGELERLITHGLLHLLGLSHQEMDDLPCLPDNG